MPEGPEIRRTADRLADTVVGKPLLSAWFALPALKPFEAMAVACKDGHSTETLYSIARNAAFATGGDVDTVLKHLEHAWPDFA